MASMATARGAACPRRVFVDKTRHDDKNVPVGTTKQTHGTPGRDMWTRSMGLGLAAASGHESAAIRRA